MKIPEDVGSKYRLIILGGQRVAQLQKGASPRLEHTDGLKLTQIAMAELADEKLNFHKREEDGETETAAESSTPSSEGA